MTTVLPPLMQILTPSTSPSSSPKLPQQQQQTPRKWVTIQHVEPAPANDMDQFTAELRSLFEPPLKIRSLQLHSERLQREYRERLRRSEISMLPSYNHILPTGLEVGKCLALDVGGSTFRIALVQLAGRCTGHDCIRTTRLQSYAIDVRVKRLRGQHFFDWMADRIHDTLHDCRAAGLIDDETLPMGLAWSFPVQQTSPRSGNLLAMGKGFHATQGLDGQDLSEIIMRSCTAKQLNVQMRAIVNDAAATLLSQAYRDSSARMSLILGTGMNSAVYLPTNLLGPDKFGKRPQSWHDAADHVLVNTELSMFGKHIMPTTRWDDRLNRDHKLPDFQPMEYMCTGMYIGEIVRLILLEAVETATLFGGERPGRMSMPYSLDTRTVAAFESDDTPNLAVAAATFLHAHPLSMKPTRADLAFVQTVTKLVARRAQAFLATAIHALWVVRTAAESLQPGDACNLTVGCNGAVIEKYPGFRANCQSILDELCVRSGALAASKTISLDMAPESSIYGAAVAVYCITDP